MKISKKVLAFNN